MHKLTNFSRISQFVLGEKSDGALTKKVESKQQKNNFFNLNSYNFFHRMYIFNSKSVDSFRLIYLC